MSDRDQVDYQAGWFNSPHADPLSPHYLQGQIDRNNSDALTAHLSHQADQIGDSVSDMISGCFAAYESAKRRAGDRKFLEAVAYYRMSPEDRRRVDLVKEHREAEFQKGVDFWATVIGVIVIALLILLPFILQEDKQNFHPRKSPEAVDTAPLTQKAFTGPPSREPPPPPPLSPIEAVEAEFGLNFRAVYYVSQMPYGDSSYIGPVALHFACENRKIRFVLETRGVSPDHLLSIYFEGYRNIPSSYKRIAVMRSDINTWADKRRFDLGRMRVVMSKDYDRGRYSEIGLPNYTWWVVFTDEDRDFFASCLNVAAAHR